MSLFGRRKKTGKSVQGRRAEDFRSLALRVGAGGPARRLSASRLVFGWALLAVLVVGLGVLSVLGVRFLGRALFQENELFKVRKINIETSGVVVTRDMVAGWAGLNKCSNIFETSIREQRERIMKAPRVKKVEISRRLPGTLDLNVTERSPIARIEKKGAFLSVDLDGIVMDNRNVSHLPIIVGHGISDLTPGADLNETLIMNALEVLLVCETRPVGRDIRISQLDIREKDEIRLKLADGELIRLAWAGMRDRSPASRAGLEKKLEQTVRCIGDSTSRGKRIARLDMRFEHNMPAIEY